MIRVALLHWRAEEARARVEELCAAGFTAEYVPVPELRARRFLAQGAPQVLVIDLTRLPSQGRDVGLVLRRSKSTRMIPLVFLGGTPDRVARVQALLPDAVFGSWESAADLIRAAIENAPPAPVVPASNMAAYSGTPLIKKLGIRPHMRVAVQNPPADLHRILGELPEGVRIEPAGELDPDLCIWFVRTSDELHSDVRRIAAAAAAHPLWIAWPKKTSGLGSDITQSLVRRAGMAEGLVDYKICALNAVWSGLLFRRR